MLACILLPLVHFFLELAGFLLVDKRQACHTLFQLEGMKKRSILVVLESVIYLLVPYHSSVRGRDINQFDPEGVSHQVVRQDRSPL